MAHTGRIGEFNEKVDLVSYIERFEHYVLANDIAEAKKLVVFLMLVGAPTYEVLKDLVVSIICWGTRDMNN